jgi:internalin A
MGQISFALIPVSMAEPIAPADLLKLIDQAATENWEELDLSGMGLRSLPPEIGQLTGLRKLVLGKVEKWEWQGDKPVPTLITNQLTRLPEDFKALGQLRELDLSGNPLGYCPDWLEKFGLLEQLRLTSIGLSEIPDSIAALTNLTTLGLDSNQITSIPDSIATLTNLTTLGLSSNQITSIPDSIAALTNLTQLWLSSNQITSIPDSIAALINLTTLGLDSNQITSIPDSIAALTNLTKLGLSSNQITSIPDSIAALTNLTCLDLEKNQITNIPATLQFLPNLPQLDLRGNPLSIPKEVLDADADTREKTDRPAAKPIFDYLAITRDPNEITHLYEAKLLLVGEGGAGKTSLANKLIDPDYQLKLEDSKNPEKSTEGIDIRRWEFTGNNTQTYRIHIWDFGGQEIYHATHQFFLTDRALYLLVADSRKEDTDHPYWLNIIRLLSNNSPVLLVQNEKQNRTCTLNLRELRAEFDALTLPAPINLADDRNLPDLRKTIQRQLEALLTEGIPFPHKWLNIRHSLENDSRNTISLADYEATCRRHGICDRDKMLTLSKHLHSLGTALHFQHDPILRQTIILKPNWATAAVYKVLDNDQVKTNLGQFTTADLTQIWSANQYKHLHHELLQLMKQFKVCYEIPHRPDHYIAPHLLSNAPPDYEFDQGNNLTLRYRYKGFMPKGLLTLFIVEMHRQIENVSCPDQALVWRTGVVLKSNSARAEILENQTHREIQIRINGTRPRDLLTTINHEFEKIHASFDDRLAYDTLIPCTCTTCKPSPKPFTFPLDRLYHCLDKGRYQIECHESGEDVQVRGLIDGVIEPHYPDELYDFDRQMSDIDGTPFRPTRPPTHRSRKSTRPRHPPTAPIVIENHNHIHATNQQNQTMPESSKTNNFNGPMSGVIGSDNAQVSNNTFTQVNNADTAELLQLIASLRQTATTLPADTQDAIIIDLDDIEAEVQKPEAERNPKKLKQRLTAILLAAGVAANGVASMTDFANTALDLGSKLGIELQLPSSS